MFRKEKRIPRGTLTYENQKTFTIVFVAAFFAIFLISFMISKVSEQPLTLIWTLPSGAVILGVIYSYFYKKDKISDDKETAFAFRYSYNEWHPITTEEQLLLKSQFEKMKNSPSSLIVQTIVTFISVSISCVYVAFSLEISYDSYSSVLSIDIIITLLVIVYRYITCQIWANHTDTADVCILPVYMTYKYTKKEKNQTIELYHAIAYFKGEKYVFNIQNKDMMATDIYVVNVGRCSHIFPVYIEDHYRNRR